MERVIHKLSLKPSSREVYKIPMCDKDPILLSVQMQSMIPTIWYERNDPVMPAVHLGTGHDIPEKTEAYPEHEVEVITVFTGESFTIPEGFTFAGTAASHDFTKSPLVAHVYVKGFDVSHNNK